MWPGVSLNGQAGFGETHRAKRGEDWMTVEMMGV